MSKIFLYKISDYTSTDALRKYRDDNNLSNTELAAKINERLSAVTLAGWISAGRVPKPVLKKLGLRASGGSSTRTASGDLNMSKGGEIYLAYVDRDKEVAFKAFCEAVNINIKTVL